MDLPNARLIIAPEFIYVGEHRDFLYRDNGTTAGNGQSDEGFVFNMTASLPVTQQITAMQARATEYIPAALAKQVVAHSKLLGPKQTDEISFTVPSEPGDYPYVCSFPAHAMAGMRGVLVVK